MTKPYHREYWSKERMLAVLCFVVGSASFALFVFNERTDPTVPLILLFLSIFWWECGITGHGSL